MAQINKNYKKFIIELFIITAADELEQIENRPSGLVNRTVRDAARAETFAWDVNGREF